MKYAIVTGASKGLGEAIAKRLINEQIAIVSVSRTENEDLKKLAQEKKTFYHHFSCNLSLEKEVEEVFMFINHYIFEKEPEEILLFNNAGIIEPIENVGNLDLTPMVRNIKVNLVAPILITNLLFKEAHLASTPIQVINITSGAANRPIEGWSVYCSSKSALNMFTKTAAIEQKEKKTKNKIIAFNPGVMDTKMHETVRTAFKDAFKEIDKDKEYKKKTRIVQVEDAANYLIDLVLSGNLENGKVYHMKEQ
ncbi:SDR family NAD(P)-dependent oxidoreductase [Neobacillus mesonae]|uniref:SDR family NAD(P)-dependent oxidoreductase n=1 Tax=Neobacillus mesonae TaxID=1193713 RepID=UPI0020410BC5|nr:SDR family NAD(P)-dependent oxidoreductase [Neobacillus mesonae]MCM3567517.1 SDR family NAD(P)-dependent oxidoreductase [Neobacillus mesonae]